MRINKSLIAYTPTTGAGSGTVTSVALTAPTGFTVTGSPITSSGTLALSFATGYGIPPLMTGNAGRFLTTNGTTMSWVNIAGTDITGAALTETDDTNVTMTLGGTPSTALLRSVSMTLGWAGQLAVSRGGTGAATLTGVLIGNGTSAITAVVGGPNQILRVNGTATGYEFYSATFLTNPMTLNGDMIAQIAGVPGRIAGPTPATKHFLTSTGTGSAANTPTWQTLSAADITGSALTRTNDTNVTITLGGSASTALLNAASLTMGWTGQLSAGRGGTGTSGVSGVMFGNLTAPVTGITGIGGQILRINPSTLAYEFWSATYMDNPMTSLGDIIYGNAAGAPLRLGANTTANNMYLRSVSSGSPAWASIQGGDIVGAALTETDDTNVTMTLGGTPSNALLRSVSMTLGWTGQLAVGRGGSGASTLTGVLIGNGTSAFTGVAGTANQMLRRNSANTAYEFFTPLFPTGSGTTNYVAKWTPSGAVLGDSQILDNGTNVGIGISPSHKLDVNGTIALSGTAFAVKSSTYNVIYDGGGSATLTLGDATTPLNAYDNTSHSFRNRGGGVGFAVINATGLGVGISPSHKLDVNGNIGLAGKIFAGFGGIFHAIYDQNANQAITIGDSSNPNTYYAQTNHVFTDRPGTTTFGTFSSAGLVLSTGRLQLPSANYLTYGGVYGVNIPSITGTSGTGAFLSFHPSGSSSGERMRLSDNGQLRLNGYTSTTSFTGIVQGYLAFTSGGNIITTATPGGVSGTQNYLAKFDSTGIAVGNSRIVDDGANFLFNGASSVVTGLNLVGSISATDSGGGVTILRRSAVPSASDSLGIIDAWGITTGSTYVWGGGIEIRASQAWNSTSAGTEIAIATTPDNTTSATDMFVFLNNGAVRFIGRTSNPLSPVAGTMYYNSSANNMRYYNGTSWITF